MWRRPLIRLSSGGRLARPGRARERAPANLAAFLVLTIGLVCDNSRISARGREASQPFGLADLVEGDEIGSSSYCPRWVVGRRNSLWKPPLSQPMDSRQNGSGQN